MRAVPGLHAGGEYRAYAWPFPFNLAKNPMPAIHLPTVSAALEKSWKNQVLANLSGVQIRMTRMDDTGIPPEMHKGLDESIYVVEGALDLELDGAIVPMRAGDFCLIKGGQTHRIMPGSHGTLMVISPLRVAAPALAE
jgi:mannose-6-phosphate isomerase-like protein (cupin superfamily)